MATGDIGSSLDDYEIVGTFYSFDIEHVSGDVYAFLCRTSLSVGPEIYTFNIDSVTGVISLIDGPNTLDPGSVSSGHIIHVSGTVYALFYTLLNGFSSGRIRTFNIADDGTIGASIATFDYEDQANQSYAARTKPLHIGGTTYAEWYQSQWEYDPIGDPGVYHGTMRLRSFSISDDGLTISSIDYKNDELAGNTACDFRHVSGDVYMTVRNSLGVATIIRTYEITNAGAITELDNANVDAATGWGQWCQAAKSASGTVWVITYLATAAAFRMATINIAVDGTIGAVLDTDTTKFSSVVNSLKWVGDDVWLGSYIHGGLPYAKTFHVDLTTGAIGADQDTAQIGIAPGNYVQGLLHHVGDIWIFIWQDTSIDARVATFDVETKFLDDRIYVWLGNETTPEDVELTDPDYSMVLAARTERGWDEELAQASAGIAEIVSDNHLGDFSPENAGGAYYGKLDLGKRITVYEIYKGVRHDHFTGRIEKILPEAEKDNQTAYILAVDGTDDINATTVITALRTDTHTGELAGDVLDACAWPAGDRDIDTGVDTLQVGWFHRKKGLAAFRDLEQTEKGRFFIKRTGEARWENRHARITGAGLVSQADFEDTMVQIGYEYTKRLLYNECTVAGRRYFSGGISLFSGYDMATLDDSLIWSAHTGDGEAPYIPQNSTVVLWAEWKEILSSYTALVKGTHWNANSSPDGTGTDLSDNITITATQYGQAIKLSIANAGGQGAWLVVPDSPPLGAPTDRTLLIYGILFQAENISITEEDTTSQDNYGKRSLDIDAPFKSNPNDILAYAQWLKARYSEPIPTPVSLKHIARTAWPDDTIRVQCLTREISDRITLKSTLLAFDRDFYINKVIQDYVFGEAGMVHETTWVVEQAEGSAEGLYWLLGVSGFGELGDTTTLGF